MFGCIKRVYHLSNSKKPHILNFLIHKRKLSYLKTAALIKGSNNDEIKGSKVAVIDDLITLIRPYISKTETAKWYLRSRIYFENSFIAVAVPKFSGKTLRNFLIMENCPADWYYQLIYKNFTRLSEALHQCALLDLISIGLVKLYNEIKDIDLKMANLLWNEERSV